MTISTLSAARYHSTAVNFFRPVHALLGLPVDAITLQEAEERLYQSATTRRPCFLSTPNLNFAVSCLNDSDFRNSVIDSDLSIADGMPLVWVARLLGVPIRERVTGSGLFERLQRNSGRVVSLYLFGGPDGAAATASARINATASGLQCVGSRSPGFGSLGELSGEAIIRDINDSHADFLVVALGAKKGQAWIERNRAQLRVPVVSHLGAVVNFAAGSVRRAPVWMQRSGLEWLWRIKEEPMLWRRYVSDGGALLRLLLLRVIPGALYRLIHAPSPAALTNAWVSFSGNTRCRRIKPHGAWCESNLIRMRRSFEKAAREEVDVDIDLQDVTFVDSAFVGLLMLMYGHQLQAGLRFTLHGASPALRWIFRSYCADFLFAEEIAAKPTIGEERQLAASGWQSV